jgi:hypothetical protein
MVRDVSRRRCERHCRANAKSKGLETGRAAVGKPRNGREWFVGREPGWGQGLYLIDCWDEIKKSGK